MSLSPAASVTTADVASDPSDSASPSQSAVSAYSYGTSKIVRTAVAAGVIVLALCALVLFFRISAWIRTRQRLRRQTALTISLQSEQRAKAYEIAAWADEPGKGPAAQRVGEKSGRNSKSRSKDARNKEKKARSEARAMKRGGANAYAVVEWEGVAS